MGETLWLGFLVEMTWQVFLGATHIVSWAHPMNACCFPKCQYYKVLLPGSCCSRRRCNHPKQTVLYFTKVYLVSKPYLDIINMSVSCFKTFNILSSTHSMTHHTRNTDIQLLLLVRSWTELQDYQQHIRIFTHGWCRGETEGKDLDLLYSYLWTDDP